MSMLTQTQRLIAALLETKSLTVPEMAQQLGIHEMGVQSATNALVRRRVLVRLAREPGKPFSYRRAKGRAAA